MSALIEILDRSEVYQRTNQKVEVLRDIILGTGKGDSIALIGSYRRRGITHPANGARQLKRLKSLCNDTLYKIAKVAELADAPDLGSGPARGGGSSPPFRTNRQTVQS